MTASHHKRSATAAVRALVNRANYSGALKVVLNCSRPFNFLSRYVRNAGNYPAEFEIRTPTGRVRVTAYVPDDLLTINEIFFRGDYGDDRSAEVIVDFGSNIGISAVYFLSRNPSAFVYCHEPLPQNISKLKKHLRPFEGRYEIRDFAVAEQDGPVEFGWEPTGRYGGIGQEGLETVTVQARDSNAVLAEIVGRDGRIDLLKIDIEGLEYRLTARIPGQLARSIHVIAAEQRFRDNPLAQTHASSYKRPITTLRKRAS